MTSIPNYNASPPSDDGAQTEANKIKWSTIKTKLGDPLNVFLGGYHEDQTGSLTSGGSSNAYTVTSTIVYTALADIALLVFKANHLNTGASTLSVDGLVAKAIVKNHDVALDSGDIEANQICAVVYNVTDDKFELISSTGNTAASSVITTRGDIIRGSSAGVNERLGIGGSGQALTSDGTDVVWGSAGGSGLGTNSILRTNSQNIQENITVADHETTFTTTHATNVVNKGTNDSFANGDMVQVSNAGGALPAGYVVSTTYYVIGATTTTMQLSTSFGGAAQAILYGRRLTLVRLVL